MHPLKSHRYVSADGPSDHDDCSDLHAPPPSIGNKGRAAASRAAPEPPLAGHDGPTHRRDDVLSSKRGTR